MTVINLYKDLNVKKQFIDLYEQKAKQDGLSILEYMHKNNICTCCGNIFTPETKSDVMKTKYTTCAKCRYIQEMNRKTKKKDVFKKRNSGTCKCIKCRKQCDRLRKIKCNKNFKYVQNRYCDFCYSKMQNERKQYQTEYKSNKEVNYDCT